MKSLLKKVALAALVTTMVSGSLMAQDTPKVLGPSGKTVFVKIAQSPDLTGELMELASIKVNTSFGEVAIPMENVDGIKMNIGSNGKAVIAFKNGDMITGRVDLGSLVLKTDWGKAHIDPIHIETITMNKDGRFFKDGAAGSGGWRYSKAIEVQRRTPARSSTRGNSRTSTPPRQFGQ